RGLLGLDFRNRLGFAGDATRQRHDRRQRGCCKKSAIQDVTSILIRPASGASLGRFLVIVVFLPEPFLELRIRFFFGCLAQPARNDVVVVAAGLRSAAAATAAAAAALAAVGGLLVAAAIRRAAAGLQIAFAASL